MTTGSSEAVPEASTVVGSFEGVVGGFVDGDGDTGFSVVGRGVHFATGAEEGSATTDSSETVPEVDGADDDSLVGLTLGRCVHGDTGFMEGAPLGASENVSDGSIVVGFGDENEGITTGTESGTLEGESNGCVEERASGWDDTA